MTQKRNFQKLECSKRRTQINFGSDFLIKNLLNKFVFQKYIFTILYSCISIFSLSADSQKSDSSTTQTKEKVLNSSHTFLTNLQSPTNEKSIDKDSSQIQNDDFQSKDEIEKMIILKTILLPKKLRKKTNRFLNSASLSTLIMLTILIVPVQGIIVISLNPHVGMKSTSTLLTSTVRSKRINIEVELPSNLEIL